MQILLLSAAQVLHLLFYIYTENSTRSYFFLAKGFSSLFLPNVSTESQDRQEARCSRSKILSISFPSSFQESRGLIPTGSKAPRAKPSPLCCFLQLEWLCRAAAVYRFMANIKEKVAPQDHVKLGKWQHHLEGRCDIVIRGSD